MLQSEINLNLHPKQGEALQTIATEVLYGGAAGGGKSHLMRVAAVIWCASVPGLQVYLFRRVEGDLIKNHIEGPKGFPALLGKWVRDGLARVLDGEIRFWNGSKIHLCHCKDEKHRYKYLGAEIHVLLIDELTTFTEKIYRFLRSRVRIVGLDLPTEWRNMFPRILCSSNPGNIGHIWVKNSFISDCVPMERRQMPDSEGGMVRQYIPAKLEDNPSMEKDDPLYRQRLRGLGSEALVKAMEDGDWDIIEGAFFDCWSSKIIIPPFTIPDQWLRFRSMDWGSARPFSVGWWAVPTEDYIHPGGHIPRGALVRYREWYGKKSPNVGLKLTAEEVGHGIAERSKGGIRASYGVADPSTYAEDGGPSIIERVSTAERESHQSRGDVRLATPWRPADNRRVSGKGQTLGNLGGWDMMRNRIKGDEYPMIYCFNTCVDSIRTIPVLQHDEDRPEDLDTDMEDHAADEWRYACMSRPWIKPTKTPTPEVNEDDAWGRRKQQKNWKTN